MIEILKSVPFFAELGEADLKQIRAKLQEIADLSVESGCADVEASRKINAVMTPEQLKKWRSIQAAAREAEAKKK